MRRRSVRDVCQELTQTSNKLALLRERQLQDTLHYGIHRKPATKQRMDERGPQIENMTRRLESLRQELGAMLDELCTNHEPRTGK